MAKNNSKINEAKSSATSDSDSDLLITTSSMRDKIYTIRGQKVMLDYDLAEIYGYTTSAFNQQVKRNAEKFDNDFMFKLTAKDISTLNENLSISQNVISIQTKGIKGGRSKSIYAFTEQGIYMLMTALKGNLATRQSKALIRLFKQLKDYAFEARELLDYRDNLQLTLKVMTNIEEVAKM